MDAELREVSLREALLNAGAYSRIESESPLEVASLHRFLLAVLHRALRGPITPKDNAYWFREGFPATEIEGYLERFSDRFDLFHPERPFYQITEMPSEGYTQHWSRLSTEFGSGNTSPLFNYAKRDTAPTTPKTWVRPSQAARLLLEHQSFCLGGLIKRFITSSPGAPTATAAHTLVQGDTLLQTLCLNLVPYSTNEYEVDWVVWEQTAPTIAQLKTDPKAVPRGQVHRYLWLSRTIKLFPELFGEEVGVRTLAYASAVRPADFGFDALVAYRIPNNPKLGLLPLGLNPERAFWRDFAALLPQKKGGAGQPPQVITRARDVFRELEKAVRPKRGLIVEVYGQMNDKGKVEGWRSESRRLPPATLSDRDVRATVEKLLECANEVWGHLYTACRVLAAELLAPAERKAAPEDVSKLTQSFPARLIYWSSLERHFYRLLETLGEDYDEEDVMAQWNLWLLKEARKAWRTSVQGAGSSARALKAAAQAQNVLERNLSALRPKEPAGG